MNIKTTIGAMVFIAAYMTVRADDPAPAGRTELATKPIKTLSVPDCLARYFLPHRPRLEKPATVVLRLCVGTSGNVDEPISVVAASGVPDFDGLAMKCLAAGRYVAAAIEGKPVRSCKDVKVDFHPDP